MEDYAIAAGMGLLVGFILYLISNNVVVAFLGFLIVFVLVIVGMSKS